MALLAPFALFSIASVAITFSPLALACIPSTAFALLVPHHCPRYARVPVPLLLAFGWGAVLAAGIAGAANELAVGTVNAHLASHAALRPAAVLGIQPNLQHAVAWHAGVLEELAKAPAYC
jgi:hypothetical protein